MWNMHDGFGWWAVLGTLWMLFFWGAIIWLIARLIAPGERRTEPGPRQGGVDAVEIARQRYARGEINREELNRIIEDLRRTGA